MKVVAYISGIPSVHKNPRKVEGLTKFIEGVKKNGDEGVAHIGLSVIPSDVGLIQGWVHDKSPNTPHLQLRKLVSETQKKAGKHTLIVDSNLFNYNVGKEHHLQYLRYSLNGVFPTTGNYFNSVIDPMRWKIISQDLNINLKDWRTNGNHILICTQRNGGWSMKGLDVMQWVYQMIGEIRKITDRPIVVRGHPGDKQAKSYLGIKTKKWQLSTNQNITDDFKNCWAVITYNSSPGVAAAIEGIPVFVTDPEARMSQAFDVANTKLSELENPQIFERQQWLEKLAMCHWKFEELSNGTAWNHMKGFL